MRDTRGWHPGVTWISTVDLIVVAGGIGTPNQVPLATVECLQKPSQSMTTADPNEHHYWMEAQWQPLPPMKEARFQMSLAELYKPTNCTTSQTCFEMVAVGGKSIEELRIFIAESSSNSVVITSAQWTTLRTPFPDQGITISSILPVSQEEMIVLGGMSFLKNLAEK